jgi:uncharacterized OB-fold protein
MAYFPDDMPQPEPNWDDREFWEHCKQRKLKFQGCAICGTLRHPPTPVCSKCQSTSTCWVEAPATGTVFTYTVIHHASHAAVTPRLPYVVVVVEFPDLPGVRLVSNLTEIDPSQVRIGMTAKVWWDDIGDGMQVPRFSPA